MTRRTSGEMSATITELVVNFRNACRAILPMLDRASVPWVDPGQYDGWDRVAEALFESLVLEPCHFQAAHEGFGNPLKVPRYGFYPTDGRAFINLIASNGLDCPFIRLASGLDPFDDCVGKTEAGETVFPIDEVEFSFVVSDENGQRREIKLIDLSL